MPGGLWVVIFLAGLVLWSSQNGAGRPATECLWLNGLGRYSHARRGFHILWPFLDSVQYKHSLKGNRHRYSRTDLYHPDNVQVGVDGILYSKVLDPQRASYGISDYRFAITQLAQTALRSEIRKNRTRPTFENAPTSTVRSSTNSTKPRSPGA